jgi:hypothetical protein
MLGVGVVGIVLLAVALYYYTGVMRQQQEEVHPLALEWR